MLGRVGKISVEYAFLQNLMIMSFINSDSFLVQTISFPKYNYNSINYNTFPLISQQTHRLPLYDLLSASYTSITNPSQHTLFYKDSVQLDKMEIFPTV